VKLSEHIGENQLTKRILSYLAEHPQAGDTIEGIAQWWLQDPQLQRSRNALQEALDYLSAQDLIVVRRGRNGHVYYSMNPEKRDAIGRLVKGPS
jgi:hypothetical protein